MGDSTVVTPTLGSYRYWHCDRLNVLARGWVSRQHQSPLPGKNGSWDVHESRVSEEQWPKVDAIAVMGVHPAYYLTGSKLTI